jgi:hypothetical protein
MSLSLQKLEKILFKYDLTIQKIYTMDDKCIYLELLSVNTAELCLLYIPSKYEITVSRGDNVMSMKYIEVNSDGTIPDNYAGEPDGNELEKKYGQIDLDLNITNNPDNMEEHLEENYNSTLSLKDISKKDLTELRDIFRQLKRLGYSVQNLGYKLCIVYKNYLCCICRDDSFEGYLIPYLRGNKQRKMFVSVDLETLYKKFNSVGIDIITIRQGIQQILNKNQNKHTHNLNHMLAYRDNFKEHSDNILVKKEQETTNLETLEALLSNLIKAEKLNMDDIEGINKKYSNDASVKGLHTDIQKSHELSKKQEELTRIKSLKQEIITNILKVKNNLDNISLKIDKICFDNTVMLDAIIKNFKLLGQI